MSKSQLFTILDSVESTNNYAMGRVHAGLAVHGEAWFAREQTAGKGQRDKKWVSKRDENIILTLVIKPDKVFHSNQFLFSALIASACHSLLQQKTSLKPTIKWPNDIYFGDRKAGGILIENAFKGKEWNFAVVGIGINVNQTQFAGLESNATSLKCITGLHYDPIMLAQQLQEEILSFLNQLNENTAKGFVLYYNNHLYKKNEQVVLKKENMLLKTTIKEVSVFGNLITEDVLERSFSNGEVIWQMQG